MLTSTFHGLLANDNITRQSLIFDPSFQQSMEHTACSIDQCEDARPAEPPHTPPFPFLLAPSPTPPQHRNHLPEYARHDQETVPATNTTALRHRPGLTAHASSHSSVPSLLTNGLPLTTSHHLYAASVP